MRGAPYRAASTINFYELIPGERTGVRPRVCHRDKTYITGIAMAKQRLSSMCFVSTVSST